MKAFPSLPYSQIEENSVHFNLLNVQGRCGYWLVFNDCRLTIPLMGGNCGAVSKGLNNFPYCIECVTEACEVSHEYLS